MLLDAVGEDETVGLLVWGDPMLYDSTIRIVEHVRERGLHGGEAAPQVARELLRRQRGRRVEDAPVRPSLVVEELDQVVHRVRIGLFFALPGRPWSPRERWMEAPCANASTSVW